MAKIELLIRRSHHSPAIAAGHRLSAIRVTTNVSVATKSGWSLFERAIIDTGAPVSVLPPAIWRSSRYTPLGRVKIGGIARPRECQIPAILAEVECILSDGVQSLGPLRMHTYLAEVEDAPTLIGILGFLELGVLRVDLSNDRATLRMP